MKYKLFECVTVKANLPDDELKIGMVGVIVHIFHLPTFAYEVEFCDADGRTIKCLALTEEQIERP